MPLGKSTREGFADALLELGEKDPNIVVLDADLAKSTGTGRFGKAFPDRFFDCGVAEQSMMDVAAGLAASGKTVFTGSFTMFAIGRAFEQIRNSIAYSRLPVKICSTHSGITVGEDGGSHQTIEDIALMRVVPNMKVIVPADYEQARQAVISSVKIDGPVFIRLGRPPTPAIYNGKYRFEFGKADVLKEGRDVTVIACGLMVNEALGAQKILEDEGISVEIINAHTVKPLDADTILASARKTGKVVTVEEHSVVGGLGSAVTELISAKFPVPVSRMGVQDKFGLSGTPSELIEYFGLSSKHIKENVKALVTSARF